MKKSNFQTIIVVVFGALMVLGVAFFALFPRSGSPEKTIGDVVIWGVIESEIIAPYLTKIIEENKNAQGVTYIEKDERTFNNELVEALAIGTGPDLFLMSENNILGQKNKITKVSYDNYPLRSFKDNFIEEGELFLDSEGVIALPFMIDPLIMYWNRDILTQEGVSVPPEYWDEFLVLSPKITKRDQASNILQSTVALGEYRNITHAKEIISAQILQSGSKIVTLNQSGEYESTLETDKGAESALRFYTEFSNPIKASYSWNRALTESSQAFLSGELAFYFGFASELFEVQKLNPNLNFDVALFPQIREQSPPSTFGRMYSLAISRSSTNQLGAFAAAKLLTSKTGLSMLSEVSGLPPVSRQLLRTFPEGSYQPIFYKSALISKGWLDPSGEKTDLIYKAMVESITSGRSKVSKALNDANSEINLLLRQ